MENKFPEISVVIPVKNEAYNIKACIDGILSQTVPVKEIVVVDSGSTDGTLEILRQYDIVKVIEIKPEEFNHGLTRNLGVSHTSGEFVILTVGDARPYNNRWIEELLKGFTDENVAGVCGIQVVPHERGKNPVEWFRPVSEPQIVRYKFSNEEFNSLSPLQRKNVCAWDDVTAMYRMSVFREIPFRKVLYTEDAIWARDAILAGYIIVYNPAARVYHYHKETEDFIFKRTFTTMYFRYKYFGFINEKPVMRLVDYLRAIKVIVESSPVSVKEKLYWISFNRKIHRSLKKAYDVFNEALNKGEETLDTVHLEYCGKPPIPVKLEINEEHK
jgi:rhamnosyltransferase